MNLDQKVIQSWDKFLNPEKLKDSLVKASLFLSSYEILKESVIDKLKDFFTHEWRLDEKTGELKGKVSKSYKEKVITLYPKDEFHACCLWFKDQGALNESDLTEIENARKHRNEIAHESDTSGKAGGLKSSGAPQRGWKVKTMSKFPHDRLINHSSFTWC